MGMTFICLLIALALTAVIGHGIWVAVASLMQWLFDIGPDGSVRTIRRCSSCGTVLPPSAPQCRICGTDAGPALPGTLGDDLLAVERRLNRLFHTGALGADDHSQMLAILKRSRARLTGETPPTAAATAEAQQDGQTAREQGTAPAAAGALEDALSGQLDRSADGTHAPPHEPPRADEKPLDVQDFLEPVASSAVPSVPAHEQHIAQPETPEQKSKPFTSLLRAFMEEKNIRWGELVSGILIVVSATGLVISLRATLRDAIPYFPALLFMLVTAAIHGSGLYTLRRWKLKMTSRGLLTIATLLVPLNFVAAIALSEQRSVVDPLYVAAVGVGLVAFGAIVWSSGRVLMLQTSWLLWVAIMGTSAGQLFANRLAEPGLATWTVILLAALPVCSYVIATGGQLWFATHWRRLTLRRVTQMFFLLGVSTFALLTSLGVLVWKTETLRATLGQLSPALSLAFASVVGLGLLIHHRATAEHLVLFRTAGTWTALAGASLMLATVVFAWPWPDVLIAVGAVDFIALTLLASVSQFPMLHVPAAGSVALALLVGFHVWQGTVPAHEGASSAELVDVLLLGRSGVVLTVLSAVAGIAGALLLRSGRSLAARSYAIAAAGLAGMSILVALYSGFGPSAAQLPIDRALPTLVFAIHAAALIAAGFWISHASVAWSGSALLGMACLHGLVWNGQLRDFLTQWEASLERPALVAFLLHASVVGLVAVFAWLRRHGAADGVVPRQRSLIFPLMQSGLVSSAVALFLALFVLQQQFGTHAGYMAWIAVIWLMASVLLNARAVFVLGQAIGTVAVCFAVTAICQRQDWWSTLFFEPYHVQAQLAGLAAWSLCWLAIRRLVHPVPFLHFLLDRDRISLDRLLLIAATIGFVGLVLAGCLPGITAEFESTALGRPSSSATSIAMLAGVALLSLAGLAAGACACDSGAGLKWLLLAILAVGTIVLPVWDLGAEAFWDAAGVSHEHVFGTGCWLLLALLLVGLSVALRERLSESAVVGLCLTGAMAPTLVAGHFEPQQATASALRWGLAVYGALAVAAVCSRRYLLPVARRIGFAQGDETSAGLRETARWTALFAAAVPLLAFSARFAVLACANETPVGPAAESVFARMGPSLSYAVPLFALSALLVAFAVRERSSWFALASSMAFNVAVCLAFALPHWIGSTRLDAAVFVEFLQMSALAFAGYTLVWLAARPWIEPAAETKLASSHDDWPASSFSSPLDLQLGLSQLGAVVLALWAAAGVFLSPNQLAPVLDTLSQWKSHVTLILTAIATVWYFRATRPRAVVHVIGAYICGMVALLAAGTGSLNTPDRWAAYHVLECGWLGLAAFATVAAWFVTHLIQLADASSREDATSENLYRIELDDRFLTALKEGMAPAVRWAGVMSALVVILAVRGAFGDPGHPWWSTTCTGLVAMLAGLLSLHGRSQPYAYASTVLAALAGTFVWWEWWIVEPSLPVARSWVHLIEANLITVALAGLVWLGVEIWWQRKHNTVFDLDFRSAPVHHAASTVPLVVGGLLIVAGLLTQTFSSHNSATGVLDVGSPGTWLVVSITAVLLVGTLWDRTARHAIGGLYALGLIAAALILDALELSPRMLLFGTGIACATCVLLTGLLWWCRRALAEGGRQVGLPQLVSLGERTARWLPATSLTLAAAVTGIELWVVLTFERLADRLWGASAALLLVPGLAALASKALRWGTGETTTGIAERSGQPPQDVPAAVPSSMRRRLQYVTLLAAAVAAVDFGWGIMSVQAEPYYWLQRAIRLMVALAATTFVYGSVLTRFVAVAGEWFNAIRRAATTVGGASLVTLLVVLGMEAMWYIPGEGAPVTGLQIAVVAVVLVGLAAALISMAVLPGRDPLGLSERGRMAYVYTAEIVLALLFLHIYLTMPKLFSGLMRPYWPLVVMAIAFFGCGAGEWFGRLRLRVLAEPLQRSGAFLPLLPALGCWVVSSETDHSTVLFVAGLVYVFLSMWRKTPIYSIAAALAGNIGLWSLWHEHGQALLAHPQLWLIPPALSALIAAQINRERLGEAQLTAIRYLCVTIIYVSSTGEMFLTGVAESLWMPMVLATLSVVGVMAGIMMRIRAFLYLGSSFLLLSMVSMVWHAAQNINHVWPWWAFGIVLGLVILTMFGLFEKKRNETLRLLDELKQWDR